MNQQEAPRPAAELARAGSKPFPGDSEEYREAGTALLAEEIHVPQANSGIAFGTPNRGRAYSTQLLCGAAR